MIGDEIITAPLDGTILPGITRDSVIQLLKKKGIKITERKLAIDEVVEAYKNGQFVEMFASGTAAVISPVGKINDHGKEICLPSGMDEMGPVTKKLYDTLTGIQMGRLEAPESWIVEIN